MLIKLLKYKPSPLATNLVYHYSRLPAVIVAVSYFVTYFLVAKIVPESYEWFYNLDRNPWDEESFSNVTYGTFAGVLIYTLYKSRTEKWIKSLVDGSAALVYVFCLTFGLIFIWTIVTPIICGLLAFGTMSFHAQAYDSFFIKKGWVSKEILKKYKTNK